ncbi:peptidylprolyl isomerase [Moraxella caviae]|nr:peptidylprolyl isomerase [Moraxella caviae]
MPTSDDLKRLSSDAKLIERALSEEKSNHKNLIASSRQSVPTIRVNGVEISEKAIGEEVQYHPAASQDEALFLSAQALVIKELLKQAVCADETLGETAWQADEEQAIADLLAKNVVPNTPDLAACEQYYNANPQEFSAPPVMNMRHILLASPPEEGEERIELKKQAYEMIEKITNSPNPDAEFITLAMQHSACPSKTDGGELGILQKGATVPEFEKAVFALPAGVAPSPIETRFGVHIVQVLSRVDGKQLELDEALPMIQNRLAQQSFHHALVDYLFALKQAANIEGIDINVNQENVYRG